MKTYPAFERRVTWLFAAGSLALVPLLLVPTRQTDLLDRLLPLPARLTPDYPKRDVTDELIRLHRSLPPEKLHRGISLLAHARFSDDLTLWRAPELQPLLKEVEADLGPFLLEYGRVSGSGTGDRRRVVPLPVPAGVRGADMGILSDMSFMAQAIAEGKLGSGDMDSALAYSRAAATIPHAHTMNGLVEGPLLGPEASLLLAAEVLHRNADPSIVEKVRKLVETAPYPQLPGAFTDLLPEEVEAGGWLAPADFTNVALAQVLEAMALDRAQISGRNAPWIRAFRAEMDPNMIPEFSGSQSFIPLVTLPPWTSKASLRRQFASVAREELEVLQEEPLRSLLKGSDPADAALYAYWASFRPQQFGGEPGIGRALRVLATWKEAVRMTAAARQFQKEQGRWPSSIQELVPRYLLLPSEPNSPSVDDLVLFIPGRVTYPLVLEERETSVSDVQRVLRLDLGTRSLYGQVSGSGPAPQWFMRRTGWGQSAKQWTWDVRPIAETSDTIRFHIHGSGGLLDSYPLMAYALADQVKAAAGERGTTVSVLHRGAQTSEALSRVLASDITLQNLQRHRARMSAVQNPGTDDGTIHRWRSAGAVSLLAEVELPRRMLAISTAEHGTTPRPLIFLREPPGFPR